MSLKQIWKMSRKCIPFQWKLTDMKKTNTCLLGLNNGTLFRLIKWRVFYMLPRRILPIIDLILKEGFFFRPVT